MDPFDGENLPQYQVKPSEPSRLNDEHGIQVITNDSILSEDESIVVETWKEFPGLGLIPSEPRQSTSIVLDLDDDDGIFEIPSEPPDFGSRLSVLIDDGIGTDPGEQYKQIRGFEIPRGYEDRIDEPPPSKPPGPRCRVSTSIEDGVIDLVDDGRIEFLVADDSIRLFTSDPLDGENFVPSDGLVIEDSIPSDPGAIMDPLDGENLPQYQVKPSESSRLNDEHGIPVINWILARATIVIGTDYDDGVNETSCESSGLGSIPDESIVIETWSESKPRLSTSIVIDLDDDDGIFEIPSEPHGLGSAPIAIGIEDDDGVHATWNEHPGLGSIPDDEDGVDEIPSEPPGLGSIPDESIVILVW
jgi:hypothetical protein